MSSKETKHRSDSDQQKALALADRLEDLIRKLLDEMSKPEKIQAASLIELAAAFGVVVEKMQLLRGLPTTITGHAELSDDELVARMVAIQDRARASRNGSGSNGPPAPGAK